MKAMELRSLAKRGDVFAMELINEKIEDEAKSAATHYCEDPRNMDELTGDFSDAEHSSHALLQANLVAARARGPMALLRAAEELIDLYTDAAEKRV